MADEKIYTNVGHATAYAYAKSKGYTGTEDQFATDQANFAANAQQVREDKESVETTVATFGNTTVPAAVQTVTAEGTRQVGIVGTAGDTQVARVQAEGTTQKNAVKAKGDEVIASIPSDYTELTEEVEDLKSSFGNFSGVYFDNTNVASGTIVLTNTQASSGDKIYYDFTAENGKAGYISIDDTTGTRITYIGKGSSSLTENHYSCEYTLPQNFGRIITGGNGKLVKCLISSERSFSDVSEDVSSIDEEFNLFDSRHVITGIRGNVSDLKTDVADGWFLSEPLYVVPGDTITVNWYVSTPYYGHLWLDASLNILSGTLVTQANQTMTVPSGATFVRLTGKTDDISTAIVKYSGENRNAVWILSKMLADKNRYAIHEMNTLTAGFGYAAFPSVAFFKGDLIVAFRVSTQHNTPSDSSKWGGIALYKRSQNGIWDYIKLITTADTSISGELRDPHLTVSRDGESLFLSGFTTYYSNNADKHDNYIFRFNASFEIEDYYYENDVSVMFWGATLETPNGYLLHMAYNQSGCQLMRSTTAYDDTLTGIAFSSAKTFSVTSQQLSESTIGYCNNKLFMLARNDNMQAMASYISSTSNLEGTDGWSEPSSLGVNIHAPELLPVCGGKYLVFAGARLEYYISDSNRLRYPVIGIIDTETNTIVDYGKIDKNVQGYSGYCGISNLGGDNYDTVYYEDFGGTAVYYNRVNLHYACTKLQYIDI